MKQLLFEDLKSAGVDVDGTLTRFMDASELYVKFLLRFPQEQLYNELKILAETENLSDEGFENLHHVAHAFKGLCSNLGMVKLSQPLYRIEFQAKNKSADGILSDFQKITHEYNKIINIISEY